MIYLMQSEKCKTKNAKFEKSVITVCNGATETGDSILKFLLKIDFVAGKIIL